MVDLRKEIQESWDYLKFIAKSPKYQSAGLVLLGSVMLIEHIMVHGHSWHTEQLIFDHGFWGLILILLGFTRGLLARHQL